MGIPYIGELAHVGFPFAPAGWASCNGQLIPIDQNDTLFNLIGITYGGDGQNTFALPDFRGRLPIPFGQGSGLSNYVIGQSGGNETATLTAASLPSHTHALVASTATATTQDPTGAILSTGHDGEPTNPIQIPHVYLPFVSGMPVVNMAAAAVQTTGLNSPQPFSIIQPVLAVNCVISLFGIFPSQN